MIIETIKALFAKAQSIFSKGGEIVSNFEEIKKEITTEEPKTKETSKPRVKKTKPSSSPTPKKKPRTKKSD